METIDPEIIERTRTSLQGNKSKSEDAHDKAFTSLTAGTLAISVSFISNVVHLPGAKLIGLLIIAWALLAVSLIINLLGHMVTADHTLELLHRLDEKPNEHPILRERAMQYNRKITRWNRASVILSLLSIVLIVIFCSINVYHNAI